MSSFLLLLLLSFFFKKKRANLVGKWLGVAIAMQYPITFHLEMGSVCFDLDLDLVVSTVNCNCEASPHSCTLTLPRPQERTPLTLQAPWHVLDDDDTAPASNQHFFFQFEHDEKEDRDGGPARP